MFKGIFKKNKNMEHVKDNYTISNDNINYTIRDIILNLANQISESYNANYNIKITCTINKIIFCGMGGSGISGEILKSYTEYIGIKIPVFCINNYNVPNYADKDALFIISSYSGNTEETISFYREAKKINNNIIVVTSGGKLMSYAEKDMIPLIMVPKGMQPRNAIAYLFFPIIKILEDNKIIPEQNINVKKLVESLTKNKQKHDSQAEILASKIYNKIPLVYSSKSIYPVAYRWKTQFNENSKIPSFCHFFPELDHNEINGFKNNKWPIHIIILKDEDDHRRILKRMDITEKLIKSELVSFSEITIKGNDFLTRVFSTIQLGDLTSYYLALLYKTDPVSVEVIEKLKKELGTFL